MKRFTMALAVLLAGVAYAGVVVSAQAESGANQPPAARQKADTTGAEPFLRGIYAQYHGRDSNGVSAADKNIYDAPLLALMAENTAAAGGELGYLDWDPLCDCQDFDISDVHIAFTAAGTDRLLAKVSMRNLDEHTTLDLVLHKTAAGWRVADISGQGGSISAGLRRSTRDMLAEKKKH
jgi:opacity protein-like surface antigen